MQALPKDERETTQVRKVWDLLVVGNPAFDTLIENGNWGYAQKSTKGRSPYFDLSSPSVFPVADANRQNGRWPAAPHPHRNRMRLAGLHLLEATARLPDRSGSPFANLKAIRRRR